MISILPTQKPWRVVDSGAQSGEVNMAIDRDALAAMTPTSQPVLRFFQWKSSTVSFGNLLDEGKVREWAETIDDRQSTIDFVRRPTGGGTVYHQMSDLSVSLLWPRRQHILPEQPRECYRVIHEKLKGALDKFKGVAASKLHSATCEAPLSARVQKGALPICFQEPVCNDVMTGDKKIIGGALRLTQNAILYQGNILLDEMNNVEALKNLISSSI